MLKRLSRDKSPIPNTRLKSHNMRDWSSLLQYALTRLPVVSGVLGVGMRVDVGPATKKWASET